MNILISLVIPFLITAIPLLIVIVSIKYLKASFRITLAISTITVLIGLLTPFIACIICINELSRILPADQPRCLTGAAIFLPFGFILTVIAFVLSINYCVSNYKRSSKKLIVN